MSASSSSNLNTSRFSACRCGLLDLGSGMKPAEWITYRKTTVMQVLQMLQMLEGLTHLQRPPYEHLGICDAMLLGNAAHCGMVQDIPGSLSQR